MFGTCRISVEVNFTAHHEQYYSFKLKCKIKRKVMPLVMKVTAEGYSINLGLSYINPDGSELKLPIGRSDSRVIDFGQVQVNEDSLGQIAVLNHSFYSFEYRWLLSHSSRHVGVVTVDPEVGEVSAGSRTFSQLMFRPSKKMTLQNCQLTLEVSGEIN